MTPGLETELLLLGNCLAGNSGLESGTGRESRHGRGGNLDFLARLRIAAHASSPLRGLEASEADQTNGIAIGHGLDNGTPLLLRGLRRGGFGNVRRGCDGFDEFGLVHVPPPGGFGTAQRTPVWRLRGFWATSDESPYQVQREISRNLNLIVALRQRPCRKSLEGAPPRQIYCSRCCASSGRRAVRAKIPAARFHALAKHAFYGTKTRTAVRLVRVDGKSQTEAANLTRMSTYSVHRAMKRSLAKLHILRTATTDSAGNTATQNASKAPPIRYCEFRRIKDSMTGFRQ